MRVPTGNRRRKPEKGCYSGRGLALSVAISFMVEMAGIGGIVEKIKGVIKKIREPIDKATNS